MEYAYKIFGYFFYLWLFIVIYLNFDSKKTTIAFVKKARIHWKKDERKAHSAILLISYIIFSIYILPNSSSQTGSYNENYHFSIVFAQQVGYVFMGIIFGILFPFLISLLFRKERRGRVFNNNAAIISYVVWLTTMNY
jgi:amino acid permease